MKIHLFKKHIHFVLVLLRTGLFTNLNAYTHKHDVVTHSAWSCFFKCRIYTSMLVCGLVVCVMSYIHLLFLFLFHSVWLCIALLTVCLLFSTSSSSFQVWFFFSFFILLLVDGHDDITATFSFRSVSFNSFAHSFVHPFCSWF